MGVDNNYGFKTMGRDGMILNGKYPILGFDVNNVDRAFRTTRITDSSSNPFYNSGIVAPTDSDMTYTYDGDHKYGSGIAGMDGVVRKLAAKYEHGYDYKPFGYYTITGSFVNNVSYLFTQFGYGVYYQEFYGGDWQRTGSINKTVSGSQDPIYPSMNKFAPYGWYYSSGGSYYSEAIRYSTNQNLNPEVLIPGGSRGNPVSGTGISSAGNSRTPSAYVDVEIDQKYVSIYLNYWWYDVIYRNNDFFDPSPNPSQMNYDVNNRFQLIAQSTGSVFDVNVYLTPYKLEEMILNG